MTDTSTAAAVRRVALLAGMIVAAFVASLVGTARPAGAAVHYPWQDPGAARAFTEAAVTQVGLSYCWGGGNAGGPTYGLASSGCNGSTGAGFDCSGLVHYSANVAGLGWGDSTANGYSALGSAQSSPAPGDLLFWDWNGDGYYDHIAIFLGVNRDNNVVEFVEAHGAEGLNASTGHRVKITAYSGAHLIKRIF